MASLLQDLTLFKVKIVQSILDCFQVKNMLCISCNMFAAGMEEYCLFETFQADCAIGEVILIREAQFGRMREGKCVHDGLRKYQDVKH